MVDPIAFELGPLAIRWYGILISTGVALGIILAYRECIRQNIDPDYILTITIFALPAAFLGARLYYVVFKWNEYYRYHPEEILAFWHGGLAVHGGVIGGVIAGYFVVKKYRLNFWKMADIVAPSIILGQAVGRWGNYFNQEAYGYPTSLPWAMFIDGAYRHPTFLYEFVLNIGVLGYLLYRRYQPSVKQGELFVSYFVLYSLGRILIESFRTDSLMIGPFRTAQVISMLLIALGVFLYLTVVRYNKPYNSIEEKAKNRIDHKKKKKRRKSS